jgi:hypothetical protein
LARNSGITLALTGPLALAAILFLLSYQANANGNPDLGTSYMNGGWVMVVLWFIIVIATFATKRR